jgi:transcriptional regulator with XRE-family HTH domain
MTGMAGLAQQEPVPHFRPIDIWRKQHGYTQAKISSELGISYVTYSNLKLDKARLTMDVALKFYKLGVPADMILEAAKAGREKSDEDIKL